MQVGSGGGWQDLNELRFDLLAIEDFLEVGASFGIPDDSNDDFLFARRPLYKLDQIENVSGTNCTFILGLGRAMPRSQRGQAPEAGSDETAERASVPSGTKISGSVLSM